MWFFQGERHITKASLKWWRVTIALISLEGLTQIEIFWRGRELRYWLRFLIPLLWVEWCGRRWVARECMSTIVLIDRDKIFLTIRWEIRVALGRNPWRTITIKRNNSVIPSWGRCAYSSTSRPIRRSSWSKSKRYRWAPTTKPSIGRGLPSMIRDSWGCWM